MPPKNCASVELLVRRVNLIVGQADADHDLRQPQHAIEGRDRPDRSARADEDRRLAEAGFHRARRGQRRGMIARDDDRAHAAVALDRDPHAARGRDSTNSVTTRRTCSGSCRPTSRAEIFALAHDGTIVLLPGP